MKRDEVEIDFEKSLGPWLGRTMKVVDYHLHEALTSAGLDLTKEQMVVLKKLHDEDGLNQNELAFLTYRDKSSLARLLSKMERKGHIIRKQGNQDKRTNQIFLTNSGKNMFTKTRPIIKGLIDKMEQNISSKQKKEMIALLQKIQENFEPEISF